MWMRWVFERDFPCQHCSEKVTKWAYPRSVEDNFLTSFYFWCRVVSPTRDGTAGFSISHPAVEPLTFQKWSRNIKQLWRKKMGYVLVVAVFWFIYLCFSLIMVEDIEGFGPGNAVNWYYRLFSFWKLNCN